MSPHAPALATTHRSWPPRRLVLGVLVLVAAFVTNSGVAPAQQPEPGQDRAIGTAPVASRHVHTLGPTQRAEVQKAPPQAKAALSKDPQQPKGEVGVMHDVAAGVLAQRAAETNPPAPKPKATVAEQAMAMVSYDWRGALPGWTVEFVDGQHASGLTSASAKSIVITNNDANASELARIFAHELGHAVDLVFNTTGERRQWETQRTINDSVPWWPTGPGPDFDTGAGDFAECFATWQLGTPSLSAFGPCTGSDLALLRALVAN